MPTPAKKPVIETEPAAPALPGTPTPGPGTEPANPTSPTPGTPALPLPKTSSTAAENSGVLTVWVPYDAKVSINGNETHSTGSRRQYVSYGLQSGMSYKYVVKVQVVRNGELQEESKTEVLTAGNVKAVAFGFNPAGPSGELAETH